MKVLFANARPAACFSFDGGAERTTHTLMTGLASRGMSIAQLGTIPFGGVEEARACARSFGLRLTCDREQIVTEMNGVRIGVVPRARFPESLRDLLRNWRPDLIVTWLNASDRVIETGEECGVPTVLRLVGPWSDFGYPPLRSGTVVLANSPLTAQVGMETYKRPVGFLIGPLDHAEYRVNLDSPSFVTFINPRRDKGLHLFAAIAARRPGISFLVVEGWKGTDLYPDESAAMRFLAELPNVKLAKREADSKEIYRKTRLLLVPSRWNEPWARVIGEAQASGIPVLVSDRGSSPLAVGGGGVVLPYGEPALWAESIHGLLSDAHSWGALSDAARTNTERFPVDQAVEDHVRFFRGVLSGVVVPTRIYPAAVGINRATRTADGSVSFCADTVRMDAVMDTREPTHP